MLSFNMKTTPPATSVTDASLIFGARDGQTDPAPEPFSVAVLWAHLSTKLAGLFDPAGTAATLAAGAVSAANEYTDAAVGSGGVNTNQPIVSNLAPNAIVFKAAGYADASLNIAIGQGPARPGLSGFDTTWYMGCNIGGNGGRVDPTKAATGISFANNHFVYTHGGVQRAYGNIGFFLITKSGWSNPIISQEVCEDDTTENDPNVQAYWRSNKISFQGWLETGNPLPYTLLQFDVVSKRVLLGSQTAIRAANNVPIIEAINAASSGSLSLLKLDTSNRAQISTAAYVVSSNTSSPALEVLATSTALANNYAALSVQATSVTANARLYALSAVLSGKGGVLANIQNNANDANARSLLSLTALYGLANCDTYVLYENAGVSGTPKQYVAGLDQSALAWKVCEGSVMGTNDRLIIDGTRVEVTRPLKLPSYTVATVPSAAASGAGAQVYVTNESGGAVVATSDGTNWRRPQDRAIIS